VRNLITVEPPVRKVVPHVVRDAIVQALERHAERSAKHVQIAMTDGKVILTGAVPSWAELHTVEGAVRGTPGVRGVDNRLRIEA